MFHAHLKAQNVNVRTAIPFRTTLRIVAVESQTRLVADRVAHQPGMIVFEPHEHCGVHKEPQLLRHTGADGKVGLFDVLHRVHLTELHEHECAQHAAQHFLHHRTRRRRFAHNGRRRGRRRRRIAIGAQAFLEVGALDKVDVVVEQHNRTGHQCLELHAERKVLERRRHTSHGVVALAGAQRGRIAGHAVVQAERQRGDLLRDHHQRPGDVDGGGAVVVVQPVQVDARQIRHGHKQHRSTWMESGVNDSGLISIYRCQCSLPLNRLRTLGAHHDVANGWQTGNVHCLLTEHEVAEEDAQHQAERMAAGHRDPAGVQQRTEQ